MIALKKGSVVNVFAITDPGMRFPGVFFRLMKKLFMTGPLNILFDHMPIDGNKVLFNKRH